MSLPPRVLALVGTSVQIIAAALAPVFLVTSGSVPYVPDTCTNRALVKSFAFSWGVGPFLLLRVQIEETPGLTGFPSRFFSRKEGEVALFVHHALERLSELKLRSRDVNQMAEIWGGTEQNRGPDIVAALTR